MSTTDDYSPVRPDVMEDPFPAYADLRAQCPVHHTAELGRDLYSLSRAAAWEATEASDDTSSLSCS